MIGCKIRTLRKQMGLTQSQLAVKLGVSTSAVGMYEQERRTPDTQTLSILCRFFGVTTDYLLLEGGDENRDIDDVIGEIRNKLLAQKGLMFNGRALTDFDLKKIADTIELSIKVLALDTTKD